MFRLCKLCNRRALSFNNAVALCSRHYKEFRLDCDNYHLTQQNSGARREFNLKIKQRVLATKVNLGEAELDAALRQYSHKYLGREEIRLRLLFTIKYFDGKLDTPHMTFCRGLRKKQPPEITGDALLDIALACIKKYKNTD